jgi:hypothetical protein
MPRGAKGRSLELRLAHVEHVTGGELKLLNGG